VGEAQFFQRFLDLVGQGMARFHALAAQFPCPVQVGRNHRGHFFFNLREPFFPAQKGLEFILDFSVISQDFNDGPPVFLLKGGQ